MSRKKTKSKRKAIWAGQRTSFQDHNLPVRHTQALLDLACMRAKSLQSCPTLCNPMDCSPPGSSVLALSKQEHWSGSSCPSPLLDFVSQLSPQVGCAGGAKMLKKGVFICFCQPCAGHRASEARELVAPSCASRQKQAHTVNRGRNPWWQLGELRRRDRWRLCPRKQKTVYLTEAAGAL